RRRAPRAGRRGGGPRRHGARSDRPVRHRPGHGRSLGGLTGRSSEHGRAPSYTGPMALFLSGEPDADALLADDPLALLIGMVLDQQVPLEKAFRSPFDLRQRLGGTLDAATVAAMDP